MSISVFPLFTLQSWWTSRGLKNFWRIGVWSHLRILFPLIFNQKKVFLTSVASFLTSIMDQTCLTKFGIVIKPFIVGQFTGRNDWKKNCHFSNNAFSWVCFAFGHTPFKVTIACLFKPSPCKFQFTWSQATLNDVLPEMVWDLHLGTLQQHLVRRWPNYPSLGHVHQCWMKQ